MTSLREQLGTGEKRSKLVEDAVHTLDAEVGDKGGISGLAIKGAYKLVQSIKPGFVKEVVDGLLDDFLDALDPLYQEAAQKKVAAGAYLLQNPSRVADSLLHVTDERAKTSKHQAIRSAYEKLRGMAKKQVEAACPRLSQLFEKHADKTA
jgi:hypothetical protein